MPSSLFNMLSLGVSFPALIAASSEVPPLGNCRSDDGLSFNSTTFQLNKRPVPGESSVCNDGSAAQFYFRPCCNGITPNDQCDTGAKTWMVVFGDGNEDGWCWDAESCAARMAASPGLTGSAGLQEVLLKSLGSDGGAFSKGGEVNSNFYKSYAVYVPHCSSDIFLGECDGASDSELPSFCGKSIAKNALRSLLPELAAYGADNIVIVGGAGVMSYIDELVDILPSTAKVSAVCDGCVLFDDALPEASGAPSSCEAGDAFSCTPDKTLPAAVELWGASLPQECGGWNCLLSTTAQGQNGLVARTAAQLPLLAQMPLYDTRAYRARGAAPGTDDKLDAAVRARVLAGLEGASLVVAGACAEPMSAFAKGEFFSVKFGIYLLPPPSFASGLYNILFRPDRLSNLQDSCVGVGCNPFCGKAEAPGWLPDGSSHSELTRLVV